MPATVGVVLRCGAVSTGSTALLTDQYEMTMLAAALADGTAQRDCVFEVFARSLPAGRRYGVVAGIDRLLRGIEEFRFGPGELEMMRDRAIVDARTLDWLSDYRFTGDIEGYAEGELYFPGSPILTVRGSFAETVVLETLVLSVLNHDTAIASAGARMVGAAGDRPCIEMGSRRTHEWAAVAAARAAYLVGFASTSNLAAGAAYGIPTTGTSAHSFTLLHDDEASAFAAQVAGLGVGTTLLVDTYDVAKGIRTAVEQAGTGLGAIRLDSGDLGALAVRARELLDSLGARATRIIVTSDLDEFAIAALAAAPVDGYGVGTSLVTGSGAPTAGLVYKLVQRNGIPVAKASTGKPSIGGSKVAVRRHDEAGVMTEESIGCGGAPEVRDGDRALQVPLVRAGRLSEVVDPERALELARERFRASVATLPAAGGKLSRGEPAIETEFSGG